MIGMIALIAFFCCIANIVGTISGFGVGTIMTPILLLFVPYTKTILLVCILHWFHDVWKMFFFRRNIDWIIFLYCGIPTLIAGFFGALLVTPEQSVVLEALLGLFLIVLALLFFYKPTIKISFSWKSGMIGGILSGFFAGIFGVRGPIHVFFLSLFDMRKNTLIGTTGIISFLLDSVRLVTYWGHGIQLEVFYYWSLIFFVPASFLGAVIGQSILERIPQKYFRMLIFIFLFVLGIRLLVSPWF